MWNVYKPSTQIHGTSAVGTGRGPHSPRWKIFWRTVVVFRIEKQDADQGYRIGFRSGSEIRIFSDPCYQELVRMRIGPDPCDFFAVDLTGLREVPLKTVARTGVRDPHFKQVRLY